MPNHPVLSTLRLALPKPDSANANLTHCRPVKFQPHGGELSRIKPFRPIRRLNRCQRYAHRLKHWLPIFFISFLIDDIEFREFFFKGRLDHHESADWRTGR